MKTMTRNYPNTIFSRSKQFVTSNKHLALILRLFYSMKQELSRFIFQKRKVEKVYCQHIHNHFKTFTEEEFKKKYWFSFGQESSSSKSKTRLTNYCIYIYKNIYIPYSNIMEILKLLSISIMINGEASV